MDRSRVSVPATGHKRDRARKDRPQFLELKAISGKWYGHGTVTTDRGSRRLRYSTRLPATERFKEDALDLLWRIEQETLDELLTGIVAVAVSVAIVEYLELGAEGEPNPGGRGDLLGGADRRVLAELNERFGARVLKSLDEVEWQAFINERHKNNLIDTKRRYVSPIRTFLIWCAEAQRRYIGAVPNIMKKGTSDKKRVMSQKRKDRIQVAEATSDLLSFLFDRAHITLKAQLYTEWSTGARVSSILFGCKLSDLTITGQTGRIIFRDTKNSDDVAAELHPATVAVLTEYLKWRGDLHKRHDPLFLTYRWRPYSDLGLKQGWSGQNKTGFNAMKRRAIADLRLEAAKRAKSAYRAGQVGEAWAIVLDAKSKTNLIRKLTQHWIRHWFATHALASGMPRASVMAQGGWRDERSMEHYEHDVPAVRQEAIRQLAIGKNLAASEASPENSLRNKRKMR